MTIYDARRAKRVTKSTAPLGGAGMQLHVLPAGSTYNPATGKATLPP